MSTKRVVIAGINSGSGKTTITSGIMRLLKNKGYKVQGFKSGPDYIDPSYHSIATGNFSRNLDTWMLGEELVKEMIAKNSEESDISVIEGVMGLFDGRSGTEELGSTSHLAKITGSPVILVLDSRSIARSAAAMVYGYMNYDTDLNVKGVILNKVASERHLKILMDAIEPLGIDIIGHVMRNEKLKMPERHLGLIPATEMEGLSDHLDYISSELEKTIDIDKILKLADNAESYPIPKEFVFKKEDQGLFRGLKIGYAFDKAFSFYYHDGLDYLRHMGAELIKVSPINDPKLPEDLNGLIIGGGFPELFLDELNSNDGFVSSLKSRISEGMPLYAECGGYMYLNKTILDFDNNEIEMTGIIPGKVEMTKKLVSMGYREAEIQRDSVMGTKGEKLIGHEFHYSKFVGGNDYKSWALEYNNGKFDGYADDNVFASYLHMHFAANPKIAKNFMNSCKNFRI